jgi:hypothetical protein
MTAIGMYLMLLSIWATILTSFSRFAGYNLQDLFPSDNAAQEQDADIFLGSGTRGSDADTSQSASDEPTDITVPVESTLSSDKPTAYLVALDHNNPFLPEIITLYEAPEIHIGRSPHYCDVILNDMRISRIHATILHENNQFHIKDEGSSGGTFVNRLKINPTVEKLLAPGNIVYFSTLGYRFEPIKSSEEKESTELSTKEDKPETLTPDNVKKLLEEYRLEG